MDTHAGLRPSLTRQPPFCALLPAGPSLAAELQRQLSQRRTSLAAGVTAVPPVRAPPQRDLLGRRLAPSAHPLASASSGGSGAGASSAAGVSSASSGEIPSAYLPLSARGSLHYKHGRGCAAVLGVQVVGASPPAVTAAPPLGSSAYTQA